MKLDEKDYLEHYGILRRSGRYPWGSGGTQSARNKKFLDTIEDMKNQGMTETEIARAFSRPDQPFTTTQLRALKSIARAEQRQQLINQAQRLKDKGYSNDAIAKRLGLKNESSVRSLLAPGQKEKADILQSTADMLKRQVEEKGYIDIGTQVEKALPLSDNPAAQIGLSSTKFNTAVAILREQGYTVHYVKVPQLGTNQMTTVKVLAKPGVKYAEVYRNRDQIKLISEHTTDSGRTYLGLKPPVNLSSKRVSVVYDEDGGSNKDGLIEIRPSAKDLDMGKARYAQVRIAVDGTHYLKGMAIYNPDLPAGTDVRFNTNKSKKLGKKAVMKEMEKTKDGKIDLDNPFGAVIKPGGQRGALNIVNEQGDWDNWSRNLPSQMLSKQNPKLAKTQLDVTYERRRKELDAILALNNPAVRRKLLETYADETDSAAVTLKAAARLRQTTKVLIPVPSMKPTEIYAPSLRDGERVALVRFPHGGTFEIPELTVNNRNPEARKLLGNRATDAVGIHHKVAERLSGADFDGDNVLVIPNNKGEIKSSPALQGLKDFDPRSAYPAYDGMKPITGPRMQQEMGNVSNLITDMTIRGASQQELARAVRHSMVVIDSEKHNLDYKGSARDNGIAQLKKKYQGKASAGASTLLSRATAEVRVPVRKPRPAKDGGPIDKKTGKKVFVDTGETYVDRDGKTVRRTFKSQRLAETDDAHTLSSGTPIERVYADHSNRLKSLGDHARREMVNTRTIPYSPSAKRVYHNEVETLNSKLNIALRNAPLERQAQVLANSIVSQKRAANPNMDSADLKKIKRQALDEARYRTGAKKQRIELTQREWDAIQAGAISNHKLEQILNNADLETVRRLATPRQQLVMTSAKAARAQAMLDAGFTQAEVADQLGVALSTLKLSLDG